MLTEVFMYINLFLTRAQTIAKVDELGQFHQRSTDSISATVSFTILIVVRELIILRQFGPLLKQALFFCGSRGSSKNWLSLKIKPP